jgi:ATP/maltotriose-dependent transcriptional regulator MalT
MEAIAHRVDALRAPIGRAIDELARASRALAVGQMIEAEERLDHLQVLLERYPRLNSSQRMHQMVRFLLRREQQVGAAAGSLIAEVSSVAKGSAVDSWMAQCLLAALLCDEGRFDEAAAAVGVIAGDDFAGLQVFPFGRAYVPCAALLAEACAALRDPRSSALYDRLLPYATQIAVWNVVVFTPVPRPLGLLAMTLGRWEDAERHFADALAMSEAAGARAWAAWTQHDLARMILVRGAPGDRKRAEELLDHAEASANELGMVRLQRAVARVRVDAHAVTSAAPRIAAPQPLDRLTAREVEVLRLLATGCSNPEIAQALVLSTKTVERHLANVYAKIGARNRVEATAYAARHGLL